MVTIAGANQAGLPNLAAFAPGVGGGVKTGLFLRDFEIGIIKPYQNNPNAGEQFKRIMPGLSPALWPNSAHELLTAQEYQKNKSDEYRTISYPL